MNTLPKGKKIVLFDGVCNLCNHFVNKIIDNDKNDKFIFTAIDSNHGKEITTYLQIDTTKIESIILFEPGVSYDLKSTAALKIMKEFRGIWVVTQVGYLMPERLRDAIYDIVARNRYKWFGKKESCRIPSPELKAKFLD